MVRPCPIPRKSCSGLENRIASSAFQMRQCWPPRRWKHCYALQSRKQSHCLPPAGAKRSSDPFRPSSGHANFPRVVNNGSVSIGRTLIALGIVILVLGVVLTLGEKLPIRLGRLPGDIVIRGKNSAFYFPLVTCLLVSVVLSFLLWLFGKL